MRRHATLAPGVVPDEALDVSYALVSPTAITKHRLSISDPNILFDGYAIPTTNLSTAGAQIALQRYGVQATSTVPEPGSRALVVVGRAATGATAVRAGGPPAGTTSSGSGSISAYATSGTGAGVYVIAILGTPSTTGKWILQPGGHHLAINLAYNGAATPIPTPYHIGIKPQTFTVNGTTYTPLQANATAMYTLVNSLDATQYAKASLSTTYTDLLLGAREGSAAARVAR